MNPKNNTVSLKPRKDAQGMSLLTPKQMKLLEWIEAFVREKGFMPSRREMADGMGVSSVATIQQHVEAIEAKGFLKLQEGVFRGVKLSRRWEKSQARRLALLKGEETSAEAAAKLETKARALAEEYLTQARAETELVSSETEFEVPLLGRVAAGYPIEVFSTEETIAVPTSMRGGGKRELFALRVQGDSMIGDGILNGDLIVCEKRETARSGETVVALWKGEATLKRLEKTREGVELHPANPQYPVMQVKDEDSFQVQGVLTGVLRTYGIDTRLGSAGSGSRARAASESAFGSGRKTGNSGSRR